MVYDDDIAMALEMVEEFGQQCQWQQIVTTLTDPNKPWLGGVDVPVSHQPFICFLPATDSNSGFGISKLRSSEDTVAFSTYGLMGAQDFTPAVPDKVLRDGEPLVVTAIDVLKPNGFPILYILAIA